MDEKTLKNIICIAIIAITLGFFWFIFGATQTTPQPVQVEVHTVQ